MKKIISILLSLVLVFGACCNVFADGELTPEKVSENVLAYYDDNKDTIMAALKEAAGDAAYLIDQFDIKASISSYLGLHAEDICDFCIEICGLNADKDTKTAKIEEYLAKCLAGLFDIMYPGAGNLLSANIQSFASEYAPTIVEQYKTQLNLATIVSDNPLFFVGFSLVELVVIIGLLVALSKSKKAAK